MKSRLLVPVLLFVAVGTALFFVLGKSGGREPVRMATAPPGTAKRGMDEGTPPSDPALPAIEENEELATRVAAGPKPASSADENFDTEDARMVPIRVVLPLGVPADDEAMLYGLSDLENETWPRWLDSVPISLMRGGEAAEAALSRSKLSWSRRPVPGSGVVELPFAREGKASLVVLVSNYVLAEPAFFSLDDSPPVLEGTLGAWVTGRLLFPGEGTIELPAPDKLKFEFQGRGEGGFFRGSRGEERRALLDADYQFSLRALDAEKKYLVRLPVEGRVDFTQLSFQVQPGEHRVFDLTLELGASVEGLVVDEGGTPVPNARVTGDGKGSLLTSGLGGSEKAVTDEAGAFSLSGLPPGKLEVQAESEGWVASEPVALEVQDGEVATEVRLVLSRGKRIAGRVLWPDGTAADGSQVSIETPSRFGLRSGPSVQAGDDGSFVITGLGDGPFDVFAHHAPRELPGDPPTEDRNPTLAEPAAWTCRMENVGAQSVGLALVLDAPKSVRGLVLDDTGAPLEAIEVQATLPEQPRWGSPVSRGISSKSGAFEIGALHNGNWVLRASSDTYTAADPDGVRVTIPQGPDPITLVMNRNLVVSGVVLDPSGAPVPNATVTGRLGEGTFGRFERTEVETDENGAFEMGTCPASGASLVATAEDWAPSEALTVAGEPGENIEGIVLSLRVGATITGVVWNREGQPDVGANVSAGKAGNGNPFGGENATTADSEGLFRFEHVTPGKVRVLAMPREEDLLESLSDVESQESAMASVFGQMRSETVEVADGEEVHVTLGFPAKKPVHVTGVVLEGRRAVADASVMVFEEGASILVGMKAGKTGGDGHFELTVDRPGDFTFHVLGDGVGGDSTSFPVVVPDVEEFDVELSLPSGVIAGVVLSPEGTPVGGINIRLQTMGGGLDLFSLRATSSHASSADGNFRIEHLHAGTYTLVAGGEAVFFGGAAPPYSSAVLADLELGPNEVRDQLVVRLSRPGKVIGRVVDASGAPVAGASVFVRDGNGHLLSTISGVSSDASGNFRYPAVPEGSAIVLARSGDLASDEVGPVRVRANSETEVELVLDEGCYLTVELIVDGEPGRARIEVRDSEDRVVSGLLGEKQLQDFLSIGSSSREHRIGPLPPGRYTVLGEDSEGRTAKKRVTVDRRRHERKVKLRVH